MTVPPIPQPKFHLDQTVVVRNYFRRPRVWEGGTVTGIEVRATRTKAGQGWWVAYTVRLTRDTTYGGAPLKRRDLSLAEEDVRAN